MMDEEGRPARDDICDPAADQLVATLERRAEAVGDGPRFVAADVVRAGRRTLRRRRAAAGAAVVAVVGAVLTVSVVARPPAPPPSTASTASTASPAPSGSAVAAERVDLLADNTVYRADGSRVALDLPAGRTASTVIRVPSGWVVDAEGSDSFEAWFVPDRGSARALGKVFGNLDVSPDGRVLVVAHSGDHVGAYELPSLRQIGRHAFDEGMGPVVVGVTGEVALLKGASGDGTPSKAAVWNFRTGSFTVTAADIETWGMSDDGRALRRVADCIDIVPLTDGGLPVDHTGSCGTNGPSPIVSGQISPTGHWASLDIAPTDEQAVGSTVLIRTADLRAGRWRPVPTGGPADIDGLTWLADDSFILQVPEAGLLRCKAGDRCVAVVTPPELTDPRIVIPRATE